MINIKLDKLQITPLKFGSVWILHPEISEFGFHPLKDDKWLPVKSSSSIVSPLALMLAETKVHTLINPDLGVWKQDMVHQLFLPHEALMILGIPIAKETLLIILFGHTPHLDCFPLAVPISSLCLVFRLALQIAQIRDHKNSFGKEFGSCVFLTRSSILFGWLVTMSCQQ